MRGAHWYQPLPKRGTIALTAPAAPPRSIADVEKAVQYLEKLGYRVTVGKSCIANTWRFSPEADQQRSAELTAFFLDPKIDAIFTVRGGYGSIRLLDRLDYLRIVQHRKLFVGFSDLTALQAALFRYGRLITLSAPFPYQLAAMEGTPQEQEFWHLATAPPPHQLHFPESVVYQSGRATGYLLCGNLTMFGALCGTPYDPFLYPTIGCFEDVNEPPYRIDRLFAQLWLRKAPLRALLLGNFRTASSARAAMERLLRCLPAHFPLPMLQRIQYGHQLPSRPLPFGALVTLDTQSRTLQLDTAHPG